MAVTNQQIIDYLNANPNITGPELQAVMDQFKVSPAQIAAALSEDASKYGTQTQTLVNPESGQMNVDLRNLGAGFNAYQDESGQMSGFSRVDPSRPGMIQLYGPNGEYRGEEKIQSLGSQIWSDIGPVAKAFAATTLTQGLMGSDLFDGATSVADADLAGGLIPEFGTNAAYNGFMTSAMTPEAIAAMDAIVAASPEVVGSGALLTDAAAGVTTPPVSTNAVTNTVTTPTTTPTTPPTTTPTTIPTGLMNGLTADQLLNLAKAGLTLAGTVGVTKALTPDRVAATPVGALPTQGVPLNTEDYYKAIQQNYNSLLPSMPRDVSTPLMNWYNSKYGS